MTAASAAAVGATVVVVTGGARSGKSGYAEAWAKARGHKSVLYIATAWPGDDEMVERIERHRSDRPANWTTWEQTRDLAQIDPDGPVGDWGCIIVDCLANLASNVMLAEIDQPDEAELSQFDRVEALLVADLTSLIGFARDRRLNLILVTNEVGLGLVPLGRSSRYYRDILGRLNQAVAAMADAVVLMVAGQALVIKGDPGQLPAR